MWADSLSWIDGLASAAVPRVLSALAFYHCHHSPSVFSYRFTLSIYSSLSPSSSFPHFVYAEYNSSCVAEASHYAANDTTQVNPEIQF